MPLFSKKKSWRIVSLVVLLALILSTIWYIHKERELVFHPVWTEIDKQQIAEIAKYWENHRKKGTPDFFHNVKSIEDGLSSSFASVSASFSKKQKSYIDGLSDRWTAFKADQEWRKIFSPLLEIVYETAESGNPSYVGEDNYTLLHFACALGKAELAIHLIEMGAPLEIQCVEQGVTPIICSIQGNFLAEDPSPLEQRIAIIEALLANGADINISSIGTPAVYWACIEPRSSEFAEEKERLFLKLVELGADIKTPFRNRDGKLFSPFFLPLSLCCRPAIVRKICEAGVDPNNSYSRPPLLFEFAHRSYSLTDEKIEVIKILLEYGLDVDRPSNKGLKETPLACLCDSIFLIRDPDNITAQEHTKTIVNLFLENGADVNNTSDRGITPLMYLCESMVPERSSISGINIDIARILLDHGANPALKDNKGKTAWDRLEKASPELQQQILEKLPELKPSLDSGKAL